MVLFFRSVLGDVYAVEGEEGPLEIIVSRDHLS